jgi:diguanylate cyclase (GGDEF)-like protein
MRDGPRRRPPAQQPPPRRPLIAAVLRVAVVAAAVALLSAVAAPGGFWACVPGALLLAASARSGLGTAAGTFAVVAAAWAPRAPGAPSPLLGLAVAGSGTAVLHGMRRRLEHERDSLRHSALRDPLTGVLNRRGLDERLGYEIARHARERRRLAVVAIDLDGFKRVNDRFGHAAGDDLLRDVADALSDAVREQDTVARLGGDEFCVLAPETGRGGAGHLARKIESAIARSATGLDHVSGSVGAAIYPDDGRDALSVLESADDAQIEAKRRSKTKQQRAAA